jgi:hypothetical protein
MKTKYILYCIIALIISSCATPAYLPTSDNIDVNQFGSYISIVSKPNTYIRGELISIDSNKIVVLKKSTNKCVIVLIKEVKSFEIKYALSKNYAWSIPLLSLFSLTHGYAAIATFPLNVLVTVSVSIGSDNAFKYSNRNMTYSKLKMFARFPQGIPQRINIEDIKYISDTLE